MPTLALAMIVKDEEKTLPKCLESVRGCFDQIIIADTGSQDGTKGVAQSFGAVIHDFAWIDDFSAARNFAFSKAKSDFVMWLDADDVVMAEDKAKLQALRASLGRDADAYHMRYDVARDEFGNVTFSYYRERIVRNTGEAKWVAPIHEVLVVPGHWRQKETDISVTHCPPADKGARDPGRNLRLLKKALQSTTDQRLRYYYARELLTAGLHQESIREFESYLAQGGGWHEDRVNAHLQLCTAYRSAGDQEKAVDACLRGIKLDPRWAELPAAIGRIYYDKQEWRKAIFWFEAASRCTIPETRGFVQRDEYTWSPWDRLCVCYWQVGERAKSYEANERALAYKPAEPRLLSNRRVMKNLMFPGRVAERPTRLNIGPGRAPGYRTCARTEGPGVDEAFPPDRIPYEDGTVHAILCDGGLDDCRDRGESLRAVGEFGRVLRHNGELVLTVRDSAAAQAGLSKEDLVRALEAEGFEVRRIVPVQKGGAAAHQALAVQKRRPLKVRWLFRASMAGAVLRTRVLNVDAHLKSRGIDSETVDVEGFAGDAGKLFEAVRIADVVVLASYGKEELEASDRLRRCGTAVIHEMTHEMAEVQGAHEKLWTASTVVCPSEAWASTARYHARCAIIPDAFEGTPGPERPYSARGADGRLRVVWCGPRKDSANVDPIRPFFAYLGVEYAEVSPEPGEGGSAWIEAVGGADVVVLPERHWAPAEAAKSGYRAVQAQALGVPVLVSPIASYTDAVKEGETGFVCMALEDWKDRLWRLRDDAPLREKIGRAARAAACAAHSIKAVGDRWTLLLEALSAESCSPPCVDVVIPTYNNLEYLKLTIESLRRTTAWPHNVVVVDSGDDGTLEWLKEQPDVRVVRSESRLHFSAAVNAGIAASKEAYVCLLNNDVVLSENWLLLLMAEAMKPRGGIVVPISNCGKGMYHEETLTVGGKELAVRMSMNEVVGIVPQIEAFRHGKAVFERHWVPFFASVAPRALLEKVGPLDENFKTGHEDMDYCNRAKALGFSVRDTQDAFVFHFTERTRFRQDIPNEEEHNAEYYRTKTQAGATGGQAGYGPVKPRPVAQSASDVRVNPGLDPGPYAEEFAREGVVVVKDFLAPENADEIYRFLARDIPMAWWKAVVVPHPVNGGGDGLPCDARNRAEIERRRDSVMPLYCAYKFSYCFRRSVGDHAAGCDCPQCKYEAFMSSQEAIQWAGRLSGKDLSSAHTVFSSWYDEGDFLAPHSDKDQGQVAFVLNLAKDWKFIYGGTLVLFEEDWKVPRRLVVPAFNSLVLFNIPKDGIPHCVTPVVTGANAHGSKRVAISGWYR